LVISILQALSTTGLLQPDVGYFIASSLETPAAGELYDSISNEFDNISLFTYLFTLLFTYIHLYIVYLEQINRHSCTF